MESIEKLRESLKDCTNVAGVEPNQFDTYWITAKDCDKLIDEIEDEIEQLEELAIDNYPKPFSTPNAMHMVLGTAADNFDTPEEAVDYMNGKTSMRLPEGWESEQAASVLAYWPTWDDSSPCMFGDEFTCYPKYDFKNEYEVFDRLVIYGPNHVWSRGRDGEKPHDGGYYEWNFMRPGGDGCEEYRPTKRKPRTIEDVLREFAEKAVCGNQYGSLYADEEEIAKYADELRGMMEVDA